MEVQFDPEQYRPLIEQVAREVLAQVEAQRLLFDGRLAYTEFEAARLLSLEHHQLRDERLRGRIKASVGPGGRILYTRDNLAAYLLERTWHKGITRRGQRQ